MLAGLPGPINGVSSTSEHGNTTFDSSTASNADNTSVPHAHARGGHAVLGHHVVVVAEGSAEAMRQCVAMSHVLPVQTQFHLVFRKVCLLTPELSIFVLHTWHVGVLEGSRLHCMHVTHTHCCDMNVLSCVLHLHACCFPYKDKCQ